MTVTTIYDSQTSTSHYYKTGSTWAEVRDANGTGSSFSANYTYLNCKVSSGTYYKDMSFNSFDISSISGTVTSAVVSENFIQVSNNDTFSMRVYDWGVSAGVEDLLSRTNFIACTEIATLGPIASAGWNNWSSTGNMVGAITGSTLKTIATSTRLVTNTTPTSNDLDRYYTAASYGETPYLTVTWTPPAGTTTSTIYQDSAADGYTMVSNAVWATAIADSNSGFGTNATETATYSGARLNVGNYQILQAFQSFDVSSITGAVHSSKLTTYVALSGSDTYGFSARQYDWGTVLDTTDHQNRTELLALTELSQLNWPVSTGVYVDWSTTSALNSAIDASNTLRIVIAPQRQIQDVAPSSNTVIGFSSYESANDPYLTVVWQDPNVYGVATLNLGGTITATGTTQTPIYGTATLALGGTIGVIGTTQLPVYGTSSLALGGELLVSGFSPGNIYTQQQFQAYFDSVPVINVSPLRFAATDVVSGRLISDNIPLAVSSFDDCLGSDGSLSAELSLANNYASKYFEILKPRRTIIWVLEDDQPVWHGVLWDIPHTSANSNKVPYSVKTVQSLFARRMMNDNLRYVQQDPAYILRELVKYATGKVNGGLHDLVIDSINVGGKIDRTYGGENHTAVVELMYNLATTNEMEWRFAPYLEDGRLGTRLVIGAPQVGRPVNKYSVTLNFPGNVKDYAYPTSGSSSFNSILAIGDPTSTGQQFISDPDHGIYQPDFDEGYPLLESVQNLAGSGILYKDTLNQHADDKVREVAGNATQLKVIVAGTKFKMRDFALGDYVQTNLVSTLHPNGLYLTPRIVNYSVSVTNGCIGDIELNMGEL